MLTTALQESYQHTLSASNAIFPLQNNQPLPAKQNPYIDTPHKPLRSPLFYVGDKYKLMPQLTALFPQDIHTYFEPFCGGGSSFLNVKQRTTNLTT